MSTSLPRIAAYRAALLFELALSCAVASAQQITAPPPPPPPAPTSTITPTTPSRAPAAALSRFRITGTVVNSVTQSPVPRAELTVARMNGRRANGRGTGRQQAPAGAAVSDTAGRFEIDVPSAGGWSLTVSARGYHTQAFDEHDGFSTAIVLTDAAPVFDLTFRLSPSSAIEGYVVDEAGEPVRDAQLTVSLVPAATPEDAHPRHLVRGNQRTDDRGYYKLPGLLAGNYELRLQAQPWYATGASGARFGRFNGGLGGVIGSIDLASSSSSSNPNNAASAPDPLDLVYPTLWYPGVAEPGSGSPIALRPGEIREADFHLSPIPGFHLRIPSDAPPADNHRPAIQAGAYLTQILPDGSEAGVSTNVSFDPQGNMDFSGLAPGTYLIHRSGEFAGSGASPATIQISPNSARTVDASQSSSATPVTVKIDPAADLPALQILFRDLDNGHVSFVQSQQNFGQRFQRRGQSASNSSAPSSDSPANQPIVRSIGLQPGRYEVSLNGIGDLHLISIEATGAQATGRTVTIGGGAPTLMLHVASGRANVTGFVRSQGTPAAGAMVLLVPATLGDPSGLAFTRRDQSNTDGSFDILEVLAGAYILVAIDRGWDVNWRDPDTLRRFLMHGLPLDLTTPGDRKEAIEAQSP